MKEHFTERLEHLRRELIFMGGEVEKQLRLAMDAVVERSEEMAAAVVTRDADIDDLENRNEEECVRMLALEQPVAIDLRSLVAALKINNDLERIGDHAVNIAEAAQRISRSRGAAPTGGITGASEIALGMLRDSISAFIERDSDLALRVIRRDDQLDEKNGSLIRELLTYMMETPGLISVCLDLISISKNLERVGDLATNIAEDTIFMTQARVVKHHQMTEDR